MSIKEDRVFQISLYPDDFRDRDVWEYFVRRLIGVSSKDVDKIEMVEFDCSLLISKKAEVLLVE